MRNACQSAYNKQKWLIHISIARINKHKKEKNKFYSLLGQHLDLRSPATFNEKIVWKKIHDRNPLLTVTADKWLVRDYLRVVLGRNEAETITIPLFLAEENPDKIAFDDLPDRFVIKTNHASETNIIIRDKRKINVAETKKKLKSWMSRPYGIRQCEWAYIGIKPMIIVEKLLEDDTGALPCDFKFLVFHGTCHYILCYTGREQSVACSVYDTSWTKIPISWKGHVGPEVSRPSTLNRMIDISEALSDAFDFVRVDLYTIGGMIYFSEITHYPASGHFQVSPISFDKELGALWHLQKKYWLNKNHPSHKIMANLSPPRDLNHSLTSS